MFWVIFMKKVLITGGAGEIGRATALLFLEQGYDVYVTYHKEPVDFDGVTALPCDITIEENVISLFKTVGQIDVLVNNAGISLIKLINDTTLEEYRRVMDVNCTGAFLCCREAVKNMVRVHSGSIVNISSMWGEVGASCEVAYSASKAAIIGLTKALAKEVAPSGIRVNCITPGIIDTKMNSCFDKEELKEEVPLGRLGTPKEIAGAVLAISESKYITAQVLGVNGGII